MANERSWQDRAIEATGGNRSQLGAILLAMLARVPRYSSFPRFSGLATVTSDGFVMCNFYDKAGVFRPGAFVCDVEDLRDNFRGLADHLKLNDADRNAMFAELLKWIARDYRAPAPALSENDPNAERKLT